MGEKKGIKKWVALTLVCVTAISASSVWAQNETAYANTDFNGVAVENATFADWTDGVPTGTHTLGKATVKGDTEIVNGQVYRTAVVGYDSASTNSGSYHALMIPVQLEAGKQYVLGFEGRLTGSGSHYAYACVGKNRTFSSEILNWGVGGTIKDKWAKASSPKIFEVNTDGEYYIGFRLTAGLDDEIALEITNVCVKVVGHEEVSISNAEFSTTVGTDGTVSVDGWEIVKDEYLTDNLIINGDMEAETSVWVDGNKKSALSVVKDADNGENQLLQVTYGGVTYVRYGNIDVKPNTTYVMTYQFKGDVACRVYPYIKLYGPNQAETTVMDSNFQNRAPSATTWKTATYLFKTGTTDTKALAQVMINNASSGAVLYLDNISVREINTNETKLMQLDEETNRGVCLSGGNGCYLTTTTSSLLANSTYILNLTSALETKGTVKVLAENNTKQLEVGTEIGVNTCLIQVLAAGKYWLKLGLADTNTLSLSNISMRLNVGDFNGDGNWSEDEYESMRASILGMENPFSDLTGDGESTVLDLIRMELYASGIK